MTSRPGCPLRRLRASAASHGSAPVRCYQTRASGTAVHSAIAIGALAKQAIRPVPQPSRLDVGKSCSAGEMQRIAALAVGHPIERSWRAAPHEVTVRHASFKVHAC